MPSPCWPFLAGGVNAQQLAVSLSGGMYNGSNVPCFGAKVGVVTSAVSGGTAPYTYQWSTGATTANITQLPAGYYVLKVADAAGGEASADITLTEPEALKVFADPLVYPNGKNISCLECYNGSIDLQVAKGTPPYSYVWQDAAITTQDRSGLGAKSYEVMVTDANGCVEKAAIALEQPESNDWKMGGNVGTNPGTQFIGTSDNKDVVFKANGQESIRLGADGTIRLLGSLSGEGPLYRRPDGVLANGWPDYPPTPTGSCIPLGSYPYWQTNGNSFQDLCATDEPILGTLGDRPLRIQTNGLQRLVITETGEVGIGTALPSSPLTVASTTERTVVELDNHDPGTSAAAELRFSKNSAQRWGLGVDHGRTGSQEFYLRDHLADGGQGGTTGRIRMRIDPWGRVAFGEHEIMDLLSVSGTGRPSMGIRAADATSSAGSIYFRKSDNTATWELATDFTASGDQNFYIRDKVADANRIYIDEHGGVAIGAVTTPTNYLLAVEKGIITDRIKVALHTGNDWSDHVFKPGYALMSLEQVAAFIKEHGHLPGVPSAKQMVEQGLDVVKTDAMLLEKIEELTLHMIRMKGELNELKSENELLKQALNSLGE